MMGSGSTIRAAWLAGMLLVARAAGAGDAVWFETGDSLLRTDLQLLNDAEVIRLPINHWPLPRASVEYAIENAKVHFAVNAAVVVALERVRARLQPRAGKFSLDARASAGDPGLFRDFDTVARENGEVSARAEYASGRVGVALRVTGVANPADDQSLRVDGSHATLQLGNWLLSANTLDRWWGPGHEGSLILSDNARPMPTVMVERAVAKPFETRWLDWLGPWRFSFGISRMEDDRGDIDAPLFLAWRVVVMPFKDIELGFSRTAQFCGRQLACNLDVFGNLLAGNDNVGIDATPENEPGNQMAGFDMRWASPIGSWPYALYSQMIGEDESSYLPAKYLSQFGIETWTTLARGGLIQAFAEYNTTTCSAYTDRGPYFNCAYNQGRFEVEGYRYRGRTLGFSTDRDAENYALGATYTRPDGDLWSVTARTALLNRDSTPELPDPLNTVAAFHTEYSALELSWRGRLFGGRLSVDLGVQSLQPRGLERDVEPFGFVSWRQELVP
jgi:hypothetical protein